MIKLNKESLQAFQKLTASMQPNKILPVLSNVKLEYTGGRHLLTKTNLKITCIASIAGETDKEYEPLLIDERILFGFVAKSTGTEIRIHANGNKIFLSDNVNEIDLPLEDHTNYPPTAPTPQPSFKFTREHIATIALAKRFLNESESAGNFQFVHIEPTLIHAFHNHYVYINERFTGLPTLLIDREQADCVTNGDQELDFAELGNQYYFSAPAITYVFTRMEGKSPNAAAVLPRLQGPGKEFTIMRQEFINFCDIANMVAETPISDCSMRYADGLAHLQLVDSNYSRGNKRSIAITGTFDDYNFNARLITQPFSNIPYETLQCKTDTKHNCLIITGNKEYFCFIGMQKQQQ